MYGLTEVQKVTEAVVYEAVARRLERHVKLRGARRGSVSHTTVVASASPGVQLLAEVVVHLGHGKAYVLVVVDRPFEPRRVVGLTTAASRGGCILTTTRAAGVEERRRPGPICKRDGTAPCCKQMSCDATMDGLESHLLCLVRLDWGAESAKVPCINQVAEAD